MANAGSHAWRNDMKTRLVSYRDGEIDFVFPVDRPRVTIGREADNMIQLPDEKVSKHHAVIVTTKQTWAIEDLDSTNGVLVNGVRSKQARLKDGDTVKIGPFSFTFEVNVPAYDWVPSHILEVSTRIHERTISEPGAPGKP
jgi:pSer/pThr/pTyr-binding forkhead associated (FHA) protein